MARRNINEDQKAYLIGKRYQEEKKAIGENQYTIPVDTESQLSNDQIAYLLGKRYKDEKDNSLNRVDHSEPPKTTAKTIAEQHKIGEATVKRAEKFANAVDKVAENVRIL